MWIEEINMPKKSIVVEIEPEVLKWLIGTNGYKTEDVAKRLRVSNDLIEKWLNETSKPSLTQVKSLSEFFGCSIAVFLLPEPPKELPLPKDRRTIKESKPLSPKTYKAIRTARWVQYIAESLMKNLSLNIRPKIESVSPKEDPKLVAYKEREILGVSADNQFKWKTNEAFERWRRIIESRNIIVLQLPLRIEEIRGFALTDKEPFVIVVSSSDDPNGKIFTLFHEFAHILIKESSICNPIAEIEKSGRDEYEKWCNSFAGNFLLPEEFIKNDFGKLSELELPKRITNISNKYKVSKHAILVRLLNLGVIEKNDFNLEIYKLTSKKRQKGGRSLPVPKKILQQKGTKFVSLVLQNSSEGHITHSDVLDYLSIKTKHLKQVQSMVSEK